MSSKVVQVDRVAAKKKGTHLQTVIVITVIILMIIMGDIWYAIQRYQTFRDNQLATIKNEVELISDNISAQLETLKAQTRIFTDVYQDRISLLVEDPLSDVHRQGLQYRLEYMLPSAVGFHLTDEKGASLVSQSQDQDEEDCGNEIQNIVNAHDVDRILEIHPRPYGYHFDIIVSWMVDRENRALKKGKLIASFKPDALANILSKKVNKNNELYLLKESANGLIEISEAGSRNRLKRAKRLSEEEKKRIGYSKIISGTSWVLVELYPQRLFVDAKRTIIQEFGLFTLAIIIIFALLLWQIKRDKRRVARAEAFLSNIIDSLPGVVFRAELQLDGGLSYSFISSGAQELLGYSSEELLTNPAALFRATHGEDFPRFYNKIKESASNLTPMRIEYRIIKKGGDYLWVRETAKPYRKKNGDIVWNGLILDISDLKETEQELLVQYSALNAANDSVLITDEEGEIEWINLALRELTGYSPEDLDGQYVTRLLDVTSQSGKDIEDAIVLQKKWHGELIYVRKDGVLYSADTSLTPIFNEAGVIKNFIAIIRDLSEKKAMETQLLSAQKMESIGQLAAGIAHEINTPAQFVGDNVHFLKDVIDDCLSMLQKLQTLQQQLIEDETAVDQVLPVISELIQKADYDFISEEAPAAVSQSLEGLNRIAKIVGAMKDFSHPGSSGMESIDLNHIIETTITIARNEWKYVADLETDLATDLPNIMADSQLIGQTILNFIVNAAHAIAEKLQDSGEKGLITISTRCLEERVEMRITDNGKGIPEEIRQRIFEPFFTTKEVGKGSGQGLAIAYSGIIEKHKGSIEVESVVGEGTTFIIGLPVRNDNNSGDA